ncbi:MAG: hypothetical protein J4G13_12575 [Dehalococcoidia bacterium]|nr:hypothetical protein [Dehalococcoidia bacterium]
MTIPSSPIDSVMLFPETDPASIQLPATAFPALTAQRLREFLERFATLAGGDLTNRLSGLTEPGLYVLAAALAHAEARELDPRIASQSSTVIPALLAELRRRDGRGMGTDPTGPVRRGRLLQLIGAFTALSPVSTSAREQAKLGGACPFCDDESAFLALLPQATWQCSCCSRSGGLLEFAGLLLQRTAAAS